MKDKNKKLDKHLYERQFTRGFLSCLRAVSIFLLVTFTSEQLLWATDYQAMQGGPLQTAPSIDLLSEDTDEWAAGTKPSLGESIDFLSKTLSLTTPGSGFESETRSRSAQNSETAFPQVNPDANLERRSFDYARTQLEQGIAAAVIVDVLTRDNVKELLNLEFEVGIAVIAGETVLFTSGQQEEIRVNPASLALLEHADFIAHTHVDPLEQDGPSAFDLAEAVSLPAEEFVVTRQGVYAYSSEGVQNYGVALDYAAFLSRLKDVKETAAADEAESRARLHDFIADMDAALADEFQDAARFRASEDTVVSLLQTWAVGTEWAAEFVNGSASAVSNTDGRLESAVFDTNGDLVSGVYTDAAGRVFEFEGGLLARTTFNGESEAYDANGYVIEKTFADGSVKSYLRKFDAAGNVTEITVVDGALSEIPDPVILTEVTSTAYDHAELGSNTQVNSFMQQLKMDQAVTLSEFDFKMFKWGNPTGSLKAVVYADNGGSPGAVLAQSDWRNASEFTSHNSFPAFSSMGWERFVFSDGVQLAAGAKYWIAVETAADYTSFGNGSNLFRVFSSAGANLYPDGPYGYKINGSFSALPDRDMLFRMHGYNGGDSGPTRQKYTVNSAGDILDGSGTDVTLSVTGAKTGFTQLRTKPAEMTALEGSLAGLTAQTAALTSAVSVEIRDYVLGFTINGVSFSESAVLQAGDNLVSKSYVENGHTVSVAWNVYSDTFPPIVEQESDSVTHSGETQLAYYLDGELTVETVYLSVGRNVITRNFSNEWGTTTHEFILDYEPVLEDGTILRYKNGALKAAEKAGLLFDNIVLDQNNLLISATIITPNGERIVIAGGEVTEVHSPNGRLRRFVNQYITEDLKIDDLPLFFSRLFNASEQVVELTIQEGADGQIPDPVLLASQTTSGADPMEVGSNVGMTDVMQSVIFSEDVAVDTIAFQLLRYQNPQGNVYARVYANNSGAPGALLAESAPLDVQSFTQRTSTSQSLADWQTFQFAEPFLMTAGISYWISFSLAPGYPSFGNGGNFVAAYVQEDVDAYTAGQVGFRYGSTFASYNRDMSFKINGYEGGLPGPKITTYDVNAIGRLLDENGAVTTSVHMPYQEGFTTQTDAMIQTVKEGSDLTDLMAHAVNYRIPPEPPLASLVSAAIVNQSEYLLEYEFEGQIYSEMQTLTEGENRIQLVLTGILGQSAQIDFWITLDTTPPDMQLVSAIITNESEYLLRYLVDGEIREETVSLVEGNNTITRQAMDVAGNLSEMTIEVEYDPYYEPFTTTAYADGSIESYTYLDGTQIFFNHDAGQTFSSYDAQGALLETAGVPVIDPVDESTALKLTMADGTHAYYVGGEMVEMRTKSGIRITNFTLNEYDDIVNADMLYPDGTIEMLRSGFLVRRIAQDGTIMDFLPSGRAVREVLSDHTEYFEYTKDGMGRIVQTRIFTSDGNSVIYDDMGILSSVTGSDGTVFHYARSASGSDYLLQLDTASSSAPSDQAMVAAVYDSQGTPLEMTLQNGTHLIFENGILKQAVNSTGESVDYAPTASQGLIDGLEVVRGDATFHYDQHGFLESIETLQGTIRRIAQDTDGDGDLTDEQIVDIILEEIGGNRLSDFELDADGNIIRGILETKEGIKQFIENGILTGYETVDGRLYAFGAAQVDGSRAATLAEWNFKDGTRVIYGGGSISEILYPDGRRLHTLGFSAEKTVQTFTEELADGTVKDYEDGRLVRMQSPDGTQIFYNRAGMAERITLADGSDQSVVYLYDAQGSVVDIRFQGEFVERTFSASGALVSLLKDGVRAEITNDQVQKLFTRFGAVETPAFNNGSLSGDIVFADGAVQTIVDGGLVRMTLADGTILDYAAGRLSKVQTAAETYFLEYQENVGNPSLIEGAVIRVGSAAATPQSLIPFMLASDDQALREAVLPHELYDSVADRRRVNSDLETGTETHSVAVAKLVSDTDRGQVYSFESLYSPVWENVSTGGGSYLVKHEILDVSDNLPARTAGFYDLNGDGLKDRVYTTGNSNYWIWQQNDGDGFLAPQQWGGVDNTTLQYDLQVNTVSTLRYYEGQHPHILGDLTDINGDGLPDRVLQKFQGTAEWFVQLNNGNGFDPLTLWDDGIQPTSQISSQAEYASQVRDDGSGYAFQPIIAELIDLDGDGLKDRVVRPYVAPFTHWFFQKNNGNGFDDTMLWEGVDTSFHADAKIGGSISWYGDDLVVDIWANASELKDMNGDGLPDRILLKAKDAGNPNSASDWYVQFNNGSGFNEAVLWDDQVRVVSGLNNARLASTSYGFNTKPEDHHVYADLVDVTGDGLPDRVTINQNGTSPSASWWVEVNNGSSFEAAVEWTGIYGSNKQQTAIKFDNDHFISSIHGGFPAYIQQSSDLQDINGDSFPDRIIYTGGTDWKVQFGTGSGFLPVQDMNIAALRSATDEIRTDIYDYLHISLKASAAIGPLEGEIIVSLGDPADPAQYQEWTLAGAGESWTDIYLPIDQLKSSANEVRITLNKLNAGLDVDVLVDNVTFATLSPKDDRAWLDRLLAEESVLSEIDSEATQTLVQYLGFMDETGTEELLADSFVDQLLKAEMRIEFDGTNEAVEFENHYGTVSAVTDGVVTQTTLADGTVIQFSAPDAANPNQTTQTVTNTDGSTETKTVSYGRVRTVERTGQSALQYSYEFVSSYSQEEYLELGYSSALFAGAEVTVVHDPDTGVVEKYGFINDEEKLLSTRKANGMMTLYEYDSYGELTESMIVYKGRVREKYQHSYAEDGFNSLVTEDGTTEVYDDDGQILYHITAEGYRYEHSFATAKNVSVVIEQETVTYEDGVTATFDIPVIELLDCQLDCEQVHRVDLSAYESKTGEYARYSNGDLTNLQTYEDFGSKKGSLEISFGEFKLADEIDEVDGAIRSEKRLLEAIVFHEDGAITEFKNGLPYSIKSATGKLISLVPAYPEEAMEFPESAELLNPSEAASFHYSQARALWNNYLVPKFKEFQLDSSMEKQIEYDMEGNAVTRAYAEGTRELFDEGRVIAVLAATGERLIRYDYDSEGNPVRIEMEGNRRGLESSTLEARARVAVQREQALAVIAEREQVINHTLEGEYAAVRDRLLVIRRRIVDQRTALGETQVDGKEGKQYLNAAIGAINVSLSQVDSALENIAIQRSSALTQLAQQVADVSAELEGQVAESYTNIDAQETESLQAILNQELSTVVHHWYRKILGRDPSEAEFDSWVVSADLVTGNFDVETLKNDLSTSDEYSERVNEIQTIRVQVGQDLSDYLEKSQADKESFAQALGIPVDKLVSLTLDEKNAILDWLNKPSMHFGQSAYLSLEAMLQDTGQTFDRIDLAVRLILIDILTGTITPEEDSDLILSNYAMKLVAESYGINLDPLALNFAGLAAIFAHECQDTNPCSFRLISHVNGNHYIIITRVTSDEVTYVDPGIGNEAALQSYTLSKDEFLEIWLNSGIANSGFGTVMSPRAPPQEYVVEDIAGDAPSIRMLSDQEQMEVRGAFFGFIKKIIKAIVKFLLASTFLIVVLIAQVNDTVADFIERIERSIDLSIDTIFSLMEFDFSSAWSSIKEHAKLTLSLLVDAITLPLQLVTKALEFIGIPQDVTMTILDGIKIVVGVILLVIPGFNALGAALLVSGVTGILNRYVEMSPTVSAIVNIGASLVSAVAGNWGEGLTTILKEVAVTAAKEFAAAGAVALGNKLGLDSRLSGLIGMGVRAGVGAAATRFLNPNITVELPGGDNLVISNPRDYLSYVSDAVFSRDVLAGAVSLGASFVLDEVGAPPLLQSFMPGLLGSLVGQSISNTGQSGESGLLGVGKSLWTQIKNTATNLGKTVFTGLQNLISFGADILDKGFTAAVNGFKSLFGREIQEAIENWQVAGPALEENGVITQIFTNSKGHTLELKGSAGDNYLVASINKNGAVSKEIISGLSRSSNGGYKFETATLSQALGGGASLEQVYNAGKLDKFAYYFNGQKTLEVASGSKRDWLTVDGWMDYSEIEISLPESVFIQGPQSVPVQQQPFKFNFNVLERVAYAATVSADPSVFQSADTSDLSNIPDRELYALVNGIGNSEDLSVPGYLLNLAEDIVKQSAGSEDEVLDEDIMPVGTFFKNQLIEALSGIVGYFSLPGALAKGIRKYLQNFPGNKVKDTAIKKALNLGFDIAYWLDEVADPEKHSRIANEIGSGLELYFSAEDGDFHRARDLVAVGYSGGFMPFVEVLRQNPYNADTKTGYNTKTVIGLGAAHIKLDQAGRDLVVKMAEAREKIVNGSTSEQVRLALDVLKEASLGTVNFLQSTIETIVDFIAQDVPDEAYEIFKDEIEKYQPVLNGLGAASLVGSTAQMIVNVYGTEDILTQIKVGNQTVGGYREEIAGYTTLAGNLINIEIIGADHGDYMRRDFSLLDPSTWTEADRAWNVTVSDFVADVIYKSDSKSDLITYLDQLEDQNVAYEVPAGSNQWVVCMNGCSV